MAYSVEVTVPLREYYLIGDLHTVALVSSRGSVDWWCLPSFDSPSIFTAILDEKCGGSFAIHADGYVSRMAYVPETAIVETAFERGEAAFTVRDFMVPGEGPCHGEPVEPWHGRVRYLVRSIRGQRGTSCVRFTCAPRPDYGRVVPQIQQKERNIFSFSCGCSLLWFHVPLNTKIVQKEGGVEGEVTVREGESISLMLAYSEGEVPQWERDFEGATQEFWKKWVAKGTYPALHRDLLVRSAITLKLLQFAPTGAFVAAPTTSLPEEIGGVRNWDYRYTWVRDGAFTASALLRLGYRAEVEQFLRFLEGGVPDIWERKDLQVMYTIHGDLLCGEHELPHLCGYADSKPVRMGNGASAQRQLDIYSSLLDLYAECYQQGMSVTQHGRELILLCVQRIAELWKERESGIWEVRGGEKHFTYGKVMCWVGIDRALQMADVVGASEEQKKQWQVLREEIREWIWQNCFDAKRQTFRQHPETPLQDATNFLFPLVGFLDRNASSTVAILDATRQELATKDIFVHRYHAADGLPGGEGAFLLCSFWMIAALATVGKRAEAKELLQKLERHIAPSGLMAEEMDPVTGIYLGNFPQAFSHIGYIMAVMALQK